MRISNVISDFLQEASKTKGHRVRRTQKRAAASGSRLHIFRGLLFSLVAVSAWVLINVHNLQEFIVTYNAREDERQQIDVLKQKIKQLKRQQQSLAYNGIETEKQVRERMNLHLPGEQVLFLKQEEDPTAAQATDSQAKTASATAKSAAQLSPAGSAAEELIKKSAELLPGSKPTLREKSAVVNKSENVQ